MAWVVVPPEDQELTSASLVKRAQRARRSGIRRIINSLGFGAGGLLAQITQHDAIALGAYSIALAFQVYAIGLLIMSNRDMKEAIKKLQETSK